MKTYKTLESLIKGFLVRATQSESSDGYYPTVFTVEKGNKILYASETEKRVQLEVNDLEHIFNRFVEVKHEDYLQFSD